MKETKRAKASANAAHRDSFFADVGAATFFAPPIQRQPVVGPAEDDFEREADRVADDVVRRAPTDDLVAAPPNIRRLPDGAGGAVTSQTANPSGSAAAAQAADAVASGGRALSRSERSFFEPRFGHDLGHVRVHEGGRAGEAAQAIGAKAYTLNRDIAFAPGQYASGTASARRLMAHELTHVIQQRGVETSPVVQRQPQSRSSTVGSMEADEEFLDQTMHSSPRYRVRVVGHASPRWRHPGGSTSEDRNFTLSESRARAVENALRSLFRAREHPVEFDLSSEIVDSGMDSLETDWRGMTETLEEAGGARDANDPVLRRVDVEVDVIESTFETGGYTEAVRLPTATNRWSIKVDIVEGAFGGAGSWGLGELRNRETGQKVKGQWIAGGGGGGIDIPIPSVAPGSWTDFETTDRVTFASFGGTPIRLSSIAVGIGIGYGHAEFSFTYLMDESVSLSGLTFNQWGAGGSVTAGPWNFTQRIPPPPTEAREHDIEYATSVGTQFGHQIPFASGDDAISAAELSELTEFVERLP